MYDDRWYFIFPQVGLLLSWMCFIGSIIHGLVSFESVLPKTCLLLCLNIVLCILNVWLFMTFYHVVLVFSNKFLIIKIVSCMLFFFCKEAINLKGSMVVAIFKLYWWYIYIYILLIEYPISLYWQSLSMQSWQMDYKCYSIKRKSGLLSHRHFFFCIFFI